MARPHAVAIEREGPIAQDGADREATQKEQEAEALKAQARRDSEIKQAGYQAEIDQATALAKQAGPLSEATNRQRVVVEETKVAELEAQRAEQRLYVEVRKPADAKAYQEVTLAKAERDAAIAAAEARAREVELAAAAEAGKTKTIAAADAERVRLEATAHSEQTRMVGVAEADATRAKGMAEGDAVRAKGMAEAESSSWARPSPTSRLGRAVSVRAATVRSAPAGIAHWRGGGRSRCGGCRRRPRSSCSRAR